MKLKLSLFLASCIFCIPSMGFAADYEIDASHTQIIFKIKHLTISTVTGSFAEVSGNISYDADALADSSVAATITTASINTNNEKRDKHLRGEDFFEVSKYPEITFKSKEIKNVSGKSFVIVGDLTMHGITKTVELDTEFTGAVTDPWGNERVAFSASTQLNRKDYGLTWNKLLEAGGFAVGDEVKIQIDVEGIKKKS